MPRRPTIPSLLRCGLPLLFLALASLPAPAQRPSPSPSPRSNPAASRVALWRCTTPGGTFVVSIPQIVSIGMHEYVVDGAARVTELNIDTTGNALVRYYYLEPITPQTPMAVGQSALTKLKELAEEAASRVDEEETWRKVVKTYPGSTHARTIEFRVDSKEQLTKIFNSADQAFRNQRAGSVTLEP
ncbi:MAG TPA: hypothetical protein VNQ90_10110 [Chthoniobacteraceae bacterium]|nr:hypothetical protein [Chthoniobacteraceae bacterium]